MRANLSKLASLTQKRKTFQVFSVSWVCLLFTWVFPYVFYLSVLSLTHKVLFFHIRNGYQPHFTTILNKYL